MQTTFIDLDVAQFPAAPFIPVGHSLALPACPTLAPPRSDAAGRVRLVKDVLRTGRWKAGRNSDGTDRYWEVTAETLEQLANQFGDSRSRGVARNLVWGHGDPETGVVDPRDIIAPLEQLFVSNGTLWAVAYVTSEQARELSNPAFKVSVRAAHDWTDGDGVQSPLALLHVAVVEQPALPGQGPFLELSHRELRDCVLGLFEPIVQPQPIAAAPTQADTAGETTPVLPVGGLDPERTIRQIKELCRLLGMALPESVNASNLNDALDLLLPLMQKPEGAKDPLPMAPGDSAGGSPHSGDSSMSEQTPLPQTPPPNSLSLAEEIAAAIEKSVAPLAARITDLSDEIRLVKSDKARQAEAAFQGKLTMLAARGCIDAATVTELAGIGARHGFDLSLLTPFDKVQMIDLGSSAGRHASNQPAAVGTSQRSDEEVARDLEGRGIRPVQFV